MNRFDDSNLDGPDENKREPVRRRRAGPSHVRDRRKGRGKNRHAQCAGRLGTQTRLAGNQRNRGILITLDEVQASSLQEMRSLATAVQHLSRKKHNVAFVFAGLHSMVEDAINDDVLTFLHRAERMHLADVPLPDVRKAFEKTITENGKHADERTLNILAEATNGYPFMIQLVDYWTWRVSQTRSSDGDELVSSDALEGIR